MENKILNNIINEPAAAYQVTETPIDLISIARKGVRKQGLLDLAELLDLTLKEVASFLPVTERTIQRKRPESVLSPAVSELIILISKLTDKGIETLGGTEPFKKWLREPNTGLGGYDPLHLLDTSIGIQLVEDELGRLSYGVYS